MAPNPIVFALANPVPEISPDLARTAGALAVATGRCDYPNQVNNSLAFPGVFRGALDVRARDVNDEMKIAAAHAIAELVSDDELRPNTSFPTASTSGFRPGSPPPSPGPRSRPAWPRFWSSRGRSKSAAATSSTKAPTSSLPVSPVGNVTF